MKEDKIKNIIKTQIIKVSQQSGGCIYLPNSLQLNLEGYISSKLSPVIVSCIQMKAHIVMLPNFVNSFIIENLEKKSLVLISRFDLKIASEEHCQIIESQYILKFLPLLKISPVYELDKALLIRVRQLSGLIWLNLIKYILMLPRSLQR